MTSSVDTQAHGATESVVVEAPTVEAALEAVATQMGTNCLIVGIEKVSRGGIAGFFGKETYQVEVQRPIQQGSIQQGSIQQGAVQQAPIPGTSTGRTGVGESQNPGTAAVDRALEAASQAGGPQTFGEMFRSELGARAAATGAVPANPDFDGIDLVAMEQPNGASASTPSPTSSPEPGSDPQALALLRSAVENQKAQSADAAPSAPTPNAQQSDPRGEHSVVPLTATAPAAAAEPIEQPTPDAGPGGAPQQRRAPNLPRTTGTGGREVGEPLFTADHLVRSGLPFSFVVQLGDLGTLDDTGRLVQLAEALRPWCGALPKNDSLVVGLRADRLAQALELPVNGLSDPLPHHGSAISICDPNDPATAQFLESIRGDRRLHIVDPSTETLARLEPGTIVSWSDAATGFDALLFALERGLHLGFDVATGDARRATAIEVAISIRARLPLSTS